MAALADQRSTPMQAMKPDETCNVSQSFTNDNHWIGLRENLPETPKSNSKNHGFLMFPVDFPLNQSHEISL